MASVLDLELPSQDIVKCVVVGDTGVGKTRLICARACGTRYSLEQLVQNHVPTVWAIDHYRHNREIVERSWCFVDGVNVSLRLWDTFGYHDKDRRFAYGRADVILVCFSVGKPKSLRNVLTVWYPEILRLCPGIPIILCGCQVDLRHLVYNEGFCKMEKGVFYKETVEEDVLLPNKGREVAKQIGAFYYETSVLERFGINELFDNVARAALIRKRSQHFWNVLGHLKNIERPAFQEPYLPPRPPTPRVIVPASSLQSDMEKLLNDQVYYDVLFKVNGITIPAHKVILCASSPVFEKIFAEDIKSDLYQPPSEVADSKIGAVSKGKAHTFPRSKSRESCICGANKTVDTVNLLDNEELAVTSSVTVGTSNQSANSPTSSPVHKETNASPHPAVICMEKRTIQDLHMDGEHSQTVVTLSDMVKPKAFQCVLHYLYTGTCLEMIDVMSDVGRVAELFSLMHLNNMVKNIQNGEAFLNKDIEKIVLAEKSARTKDLLLNKCILTDVVFQLNDGCISAHKAILSARSDFMMGMFNYGFKESSAKIINFPGVSRDLFMAMLEFLYTSCLSPHQSARVELITLANQLCLPRLITLVEKAIVQELEDSKKECFEEVLQLLEQAQLHNANQLAAWCSHFVCTNYSAIYKKHSKNIYKLSPDNQRYIMKMRHPPVWYLQEMDIYEKMVIDFEREKMKGIKFRRASVDDCTGCLGFCNRRTTTNRLHCSPIQTSVS